MRPRTVQVFVEGGGEDDSLLTGCRRAFVRLAERAGLRGRMPSFVPCGSRRRAFERFDDALEHVGVAGRPLLLVDSEGPVPDGESPWSFLQRSEGEAWKRPAEARDDDLHLMVQCMEAWILADEDAVRSYFAGNIPKNAFPKRPDLEAVSKQDLDRALQRAAKVSAKKRYQKGRDSFRLLESLDPARVRERCPWAARFFDELAARCR